MAHLIALERKHIKRNEKESTLIKSLSRPLRKTVAWNQKQNMAITNAAVLPNDTIHLEMCTMYLLIKLILPAAKNRYVAVRVRNEL